MTRTTSRSRRHGSAYILFLSTAMLVTIIGLSALMAVRVKMRAAEAGHDGTAAQLYAQSAVDAGLLAMYADASFRSAIDHDTWQAAQLVGDGSFTWKLVDETNDSLTADRNAPVRVYGQGVCGESVWIYSVAVQPPLEAFPPNIIVNGNLETGAPEPWWEFGDCDLEIRNESNDHHSGTYGLKVKERDAPYSGPRQTIAVERNLSYRGDMWVRMKDSTDDVLFLLGIETDGGWDWFTLATAQVSETAWTRLSGPVTPTWSGTLIRAVLKAETTLDKNDFFIDDVSMRQVPGAVGPILGTWRREPQQTAEPDVLDPPGQGSGQGSTQGLGAK